MNKPKKKSKKEIEGKLIIDGIHNVYWRGYNQAIEDYEVWLKEVASVENIERIMWKNRHSRADKIVKAISESILGD